MQLLRIEGFQIVGERIDAAIARPGAPSTITAARWKSPLRPKTAFEVIVRNAASKAKFRLTGLSRKYRIIASAPLDAYPSSSPARPTRNSVSEPMMLLAVAAASPGTMSLPRTKSSPKTPTMMMNKYSIPPIRA
jgi:hypothetical protein